MPVYLVTYDLNREVVRPNITNEMKKAYPTWAKLSESSYAIYTSATPDQVYDRLKPMIDSDDQIYIINLRKPFYGFGPKMVNDWLTERLT
jgi:hypothetical protein